MTGAPPGPAFGLTVKHSYTFFTTLFLIRWTFCLKKCRRLHSYSCVKLKMCLRLSNADFWRYDIGRNGCKTFNYLEKYVSNSADTFFSKMILNIECSLGAKWVAHAHVGCLLHSHMSVLKRKQCLRSSFHWMTAQIILLCLLFSWRNSQSFALSYVYLFVCRLLIVRFPFFSIGI